jgi:hypothetical protein
MPLLRHLGGRVGQYDLLLEELKPLARGTSGVTVEGQARQS